MTERAASRLAWALAALFVPLAVATKYLESRTGELLGSTMESVSLLAAFAVFTAVGALVAGRRPRHPIGWLLLAVALGAVFTGFAGSYATYGLVESPGSLPGAGVMAWLESWTWYPSIGLMMTFLILLFPTGRLPSPRWRLLAWADGALILGLVVPAALAPELVVHGETETERVVLRNPLGVGIARGALESVESATGIIGLVLFGLGVVSLFFRYRYAGSDERQQLKWFLYATALVVSGMLIGELAPDWTGGNVLFAVLVSLIPVSIAIAVLKHRLYDIDVVINKTIVYGALAAFITAVYIGIVVGIGNLIGSRSEPNLPLSIAATALVAVAFQPVRDRVQSLANRLVYGKRADPYELLSGFSRRVAGSYALEDVAPRIAQVVAEGTGASGAAVWLRIGDELHRVATHPNLEETAPLVMAAEPIPLLPEADRSFPVRYGGELLGVLTVRRRPGDPLRPAEEQLVAALAEQAALVLRNVRLTAELEAKVGDVARHAAELRASRARIVAAQDAERRRLERNIHDGAQQQLVALAVNLKLARRLAGKDPEKGSAMLVGLKDETRKARENLRDLARGIYPPLLAEEGLAAALEAVTERSPVPVTVERDGVTRYSEDVEAAVYFAALEAVQNVAKYADASHVVVRLQEHDGRLSFSVEDDGRGFDPATTKAGSGLRNLADRLNAVGGTVEIISAPGRGTTVIGVVSAAASTPSP